MSEAPGAEGEFGYVIDEHEQVHRVPREPPRTLTTRTALWLAIGLVVVVAPSRTYLVPDEVHDPFNICIGIVAALLAWQAAMTFRELGLARPTLRKGALWGGAALLGELVVIVFAAWASTWVHGQMAKAGGMDISSGTMWWTVLFIIPVATVLMEELLFRGVLLGLLERMTSSWIAVPVSAVIFGLWHLPAVWDGGGTPGVGSSGGDGGGDLRAVGITFAATFGLGLVLGALRRGSGSLLAPIGCHLGINSVVFAVSWHVVNR